MAELVADIRSLVLRGELVPNQRLIEHDLAEQFGVSRAAVREALGRLEAEGLVERVHHRGARVRAIPFEEAVEIAEVRRALEGLCAGKAAELVTDEEIEELRTIGRGMLDAVAGADVSRYSALNRDLHRRIHEISRQRTARSIIDRMRGQSVRHQYRLAMKPGRPTVSVGEHLAIVDAICRRDPPAAERAMRAHLDSVIAAMHEVDEAAREGALETAAQ